MLIYSSCPCCGSKQINYQFSSQDYTVSKQLFEIWECGGCSLRFTQNVPEQDAIGAFYQSDNYISHTDTKEGFINRIYHAVRKKTLLGKLHLVQYYTKIKQGSLLDIGAGTGAFLHTMQEAGWNITGLEPDAATRARASELYNLELHSSEKLYELAPASYNAVTLWHVLEHVHELHNYIDQIKRVLKPGGIAFIAVPNYTSYDARTYRQNWAAYDVPRHLYHFSPAAMKKLVQSHGLQLQGVRPMWYDSFYVSMLSEQIKTGCPHHVRALFNGLLSNIKALFNKEKCSSLIYIINKEV